MNLTVTLDPARYALQTEGGKIFDGRIFVDGNYVQGIGPLFGGVLVTKGKRVKTAEAKIVEKILSGDVEMDNLPTPLMDALMGIWKEANPGLYTKKRGELISTVSGFIQASFVLAERYDLAHDDYLAGYEIRNAQRLIKALETFETKWKEL